jgi:hypothetical protein
MELTNAEIQELSDNVDLGAEWLSMVYPEWKQGIDFSNFDMGHGGLCVAGHIFGTAGVITTQCISGFSALYNVAMEGIGFRAGEWMVDHGFDLGPLFYENRDELWHVLENLWLKKAMQ